MRRRRHQRGGLDQHQRDRRVDQRGLDRRLSGRIQPGEAAAAGTAPAAGERNSGGSAPRQSHPSRRKSPSSHRAAADRHMGEECACRCSPARCAPSHCRPGACDEATLYRERTHRGAEVAAVARPVDRRAAHRHLSEVIDIAIGRAEGATITTLLVLEVAPPPVDLLAVGSGLPIARSSSASRAAGSSVQVGGQQEQTLLVPPRIQAAGILDSGHGRCEVVEGGSAGVAPALRRAAAVGPGDDLQKMPARPLEVKPRARRRHG